MMQAFVIASPPFREVKGVFTCHQLLLRRIPLVTAPQITAVATSPLQPILFAFHSTEVSMRIADTVPLFLGYCHITKKLSQHTIKAYDGDLRTLTSSSTLTDDL